MFYYFFFLALEFRCCAPRPRVEPCMCVKIIVVKLYFMKQFNVYFSNDGMAWTKDGKMERWLEEKYEQHDNNNNKKKKAH